MEPRFDDAEPAWFAELLAAVDAAFDPGAAGTPPWPSPRAWDDEPAEEEYSRCLEPAKYRILRTRASAWVEALGVLASVEPAAVTDWIGRWDGALSHSAIRLRPHVGDGLDLLIGETDGGGDSFGVEVAAGRRDGRVVVLDLIPDCGCDACDPGSDDLLQQLDDAVLTVVRGGRVAVRRGDATAERTRYGWQARGDGSERWLDEGPPLPPDVDVWEGGAWR